MCCAKGAFYIAKVPLRLQRHFLYREGAFYIATALCVLQRRFLCRKGGAWCFAKALRVAKGGLYVRPQSKTPFGHYRRQRRRFALCSIADTLWFSPA
jgi:hypothetical protein